MTGDEKRAGALDRTGDRRPYLLAIGDSLTAGYGLASADAFPAQLERRLRVRHPETLVQNAGISGDTSGSALARLARLLSTLRRLPDLAIVELGGNDLLRGVPVQQTRANLDAILTELARCGIPILIAAMEVPPHLGSFAEACNAIYPDLAAKHRASIWPFFPPGVLGEAALTLPDRLHPNARAIGLIADHMLPAVLSALQASHAVDEAA